MFLTLIEISASLIDKLINLILSETKSIRLLSSEAHWATEVNFLK